MSIKTLRKRIALVAVSALGVSLISVTNTPIAVGATVGPSATNTAYTANKLYAANKTAAAAVADSSGLVATNVSDGLYTYSESSGGTDQTATMAASGTLVVYTGAPTTAALFIASGGTFAAPSGTGGTPNVSRNAGNTAAYSAATTATAIAWTPGAAGTYTISLRTGAAINTGNTSDLTLGSLVSTITVTVLAVGSMVIEANNAAGLSSFNATATTCTYGGNTSSGLITQSGSGTSITATMLASGNLSVFVPSSTTLTNEIVVSGGVISKLNNSNTAAGGTAPTLSANFTKGTATANEELCANIIPNGVGTMYIYTYNGTAATGTLAGAAVVTVAAAGAAGTPNVAESTIALNDQGSTNVTHPTGGADSLTGGSVSFGGVGSIYTRVRDVYGNGVNATVAIAQATNGALVKWDSQVPTAPVDVAAVNWTSANHYVGVKANGAKSTTVTITVSGVVIGSKTIKFLGDVAKIEASVLGVQSTGTAGATTWAASATVGRLLSYKVYDADGNLIPEPATAVAFYDGANNFVTNATVSQAQNAARVALGLGGTGYWTCSGVEGSASIRLSTKDSLAKDVISNAVTVKCAGDHATYTISTDKAEYKTGDIAEVTVTFKTSTGTVPNDHQNMAQGYAANSDTACTASAANTPTLTSAAFKSLVVTPACGDASTNGVIKYKAVIDQTPGSYQIAYTAPAINAKLLGGAAQTQAIKVVSVSADVTNEEVLASIVKLIAAINKQIKALQKSILKR